MKERTFYTDLFREKKTAQIVVSIHLISYFSDIYRIVIRKAGKNKLKIKQIHGKHLTSRKNIRVKLKRNKNIVLMKKMKKTTC